MNLRKNNKPGTFTWTWDHVDYLHKLKPIEDVEVKLVFSHEKFNTIEKNNNCVSYKISSASNTNSCKNIVIAHLCCESVHRLVLDPWIQQHIKTSMSYGLLT